MDKVKCSNCGEDNNVRAKYCAHCGYELPKIIVEKVAEPVVIQPKKKNKAGRIWMIVIFAFLLIIAAGFFAIQHFITSGGLFDKGMEMIANEMNKSCPVMVDNETRLDNVEIIPGNIFQFNYTLVNIENASIDTTQVKTYLEPLIIQNIKSSPQMTLQKERKTTMKFVYKDKNGDYLFQISVAPEKYR